MEMKSVCKGGFGDFDQQIRDAIKDGDLDEVSDLLDNTNLKFIELFEIVCTQGKSTAQAAIVGLLLERLSLNNINIANSQLPGGNQLIHFAAKYGLKDVLDMLLSHDADVDSLTSNGATVLHCLVRGIKEGKTNEIQAVECMKLIFNKAKVDIDVQDNSSNLTAIHLASKFSYWKVVEILIDHGAHIDITVNNVKARDLINQLRPNLITNYPISSEPAMNLKSQLFTLLERDRDEAAFLTCVTNNNINNIVNINNGKYTLLQAAISSGLVEATKKLIELKADVNLTTNGEIRTPAILAAYYGHDDILQALLEAENPADLSLTQGSNKYTALHASLLAIKPNMECIKLLIEHAKSKKLDLNAQDFRNYTALHYAAKNKYRDVVQLLLEQNVNIFLLNDMKEPAFIDIDPNYIEDFFNRSINIEGTFLDDEHYSLVFDYKLLASSETLVESTDLHTRGDDCCYIPVAQNELKEPETEMEPLVLLSSSPNHRPLLNHPLIKSFLHLKWHRIYWFFYFNFFIYFLFSASLSVHIYYLITSDVSNETEATHEMPDNIDLQVINEENKHRIFFWWLTLILLIILIIREIFQMTLSFMQYICHIENCMEIALFVLTVLLLVPTEFYARHSMSAVAILLAYTELVLLIGRHPSLATYITMFFRVSCNFIYFLLWYSLLIIAFGFSFYIIFQHCESPEDCKKNFFSQLGTSLFRTVIMLTGEFESGDLEFNSISVTSHVIFLLFIFFIAIVLLNLLNGLAVSDTQVIRDEAEVVCCAAQVKLYAKMENTLLRLNNSSKENKCSILNIGCFKSIRMALGRSILLLTNDFLNEKKLRVYLNDGNRMEPDVRSSCRRTCSDCATGGMCSDTCILSKSCRWCQVFNTIVSDARAVEAQRNRQTDTHEILARLDKLEEYLKTIAEAVHAKK